ncbi:hypothetical protein FRC11_014755 [Ceratobasidium sp. 423]|nr:hypothetical protein FRC11_014755 [Ceratobasidium sp. 423]
MAGNDISPVYNKEGLCTAYQLNDDFAMALNSTIFQVCITIADYCQAHEHLNNYEQFSPLYDNFCDKAIMFPQEITGMHNLDTLTHSYSSIEEVNLVVSCMQIWAIRMMTALYCLTMYDQWSYMEFAANYPSLPVGILHQAANHYWATKFGDYMWIADMNNCNTPDATPPCSPIVLPPVINYAQVWPNGRIRHPEDIQAWQREANPRNQWPETPTTLPLYSPPPRFPDPTPSPCVPILPGVIIQGLSPEECCHYLQFAMALPSTKHFTVEAILCESYHDTFLAHDSPYYHYICQQEARKYMKQVDPKCYQQIRCPLVEPAGFNEWVHHNPTPSSPGSPMSQDDPREWHSQASYDANAETEATAATTPPTILNSPAEEPQPIDLVARTLNMVSELLGTNPNPATIVQAISDDYDVIPVCIIAPQEEYVPLLEANLKPPSPVAPPPSYPTPTHYTGPYHFSSSRIPHATCPAAELYPALTKDPWTDLP